MLKGSKNHVICRCVSVCSPGNILPLSHTVLVFLVLKIQGPQKISEVVDGLMKQHVVNGGIHRSRPVSYGLYWAEKKVCVIDTGSQGYSVQYFDFMFGEWLGLNLFACVLMWCVGCTWSY